MLPEKTTVSMARVLDDFTPEWMTHALSPRFPGVTVTAVERADVIAATATKARLRLTYAPSEQLSSLPSTVIAKGGFFGHKHEDALKPLYHNETVFYGRVAPQLPVEVPDCYLALADDSDGLVLLEDLTQRDVVFGAGRDALSPDAVAKALDYQARYHAAFWGQPDKIDEQGLMDLHGFLSSFFTGVMLPHFTIEDHAYHRPETLTAVQQAKEAMQDRRVFADAVMQNWQLNAGGVPCLIHFDTHVGNMYFERDGAPRWLDWQLSGRGSWAWDVAYFLVGSLTPAVRRSHEGDLLQHYLDALRARGAEPPAWDDAWLAYRRNAIWGLSWTLVPDVMQNHENGYPIIERFLTAIRDLDTMTALGIPARGLWSH